MQDKQFMRETVTEAAHAFRAGRLDRRSFLALCGLAGVALPSVPAGKAEAAAGEIVMWNRGGQSEECHGSAIGTPFTAQTGIPLKFDTSGPLQGKIKEMVESGNVTADVCDADLFDAVALGATGHLEPIDYAVVSKDKTLPGCALEFGTSIILHGYAFMYDTEAYPDGTPASQTNFFDVARFPGQRSLYKWANGSLEAALMADGVARDALYPLDLDRALARITAIKDSTIYWGSGSEALDMIVNGEVSMGMVWQNRGRSIEQETNGRYKMVMNGAIAMPGAYIVPKGNPGGVEAVMKFIAVSQSVDAQPGLFSCLGMTPTNAEAVARLSAEDAPYAITSEANMAVIALNDPTWWGQSTDAAVNAFLEAISWSYPALRRRTSRRRRLPSPTSAKP